MRKKDTIDVLASVAAVVMDAAAVFGGIMLATFIRFDSELIPVKFGRPPDLYTMYAEGAAFATLVFMLVFRSLGLFIRPQTGSFPNKIPRLVRGVGMGVILSMVLAFAVKNVAEFSTMVFAVAFPCTLFFVLLERYILFRIEWNVARHTSQRNSVLIIGTNPVAAHVRRTLRGGTMLRSKVIGFIIAPGDERDPEIQNDEIRGALPDIEPLIEEGGIDQVILTGSGLGHRKTVELILLCEKHLVTFNMVPDLFSIMTTTMDVQSLDDIPLLGIGRWPLDYFWNRVLKRIEDIAGSLVCMLIFLPAFLFSALLVKLTSKGPLFYRQERCGEEGRPFTLYKLRTMVSDAETTTGPVFASPDDPRTTPVGAFLRRHNLDELPQLWNVLRGEMSLVGPRPERPHFVEKFRDDIRHYMWRHVCKPGMTGWAQVNGLRGNTSIEERVKYDLYYLENWSLSLDLKVLLRTLFARENAY